MENTTEVYVNISTTHSAQVNEPVNSEIAELISIAAVIVIINSVVLFLFIQKKSLRTVSNYPLFSLAICDFVCGFLVVPLFIVSFSGLITSHSVGFYVGFLVAVLHNFIAILSVFHIVVLTAERYLAIKFPLKHRVLGRHYMRKMLVSGWICSLLVSCIPFAWVDKMYPVFQPESINLLLGFTLFCLVFALVLPYIFLIYAFTTMFKVINRSLAKSFSTKSAVHFRKRIDMNGERKCLLLFVIMAFVFLLCWLPWFVTFLLVQLDQKFEPSTLQILSKVSLVIRYLTSVINPLLYTFIKKDCRCALKNICKKHNGRPTSMGSMVYSTRQATTLTDVTDEVHLPQLGRVNTACLNISM
ncbi:adenosine receptor A3-like [Acropora palmata]|uniref:adenosine receptor A3-like n=1 Tax=Acropora palmata TaxID=6131 RepID=UPI003DA16900